MDPLTGDVYGVEIENFKTAFLKRHPDLVPVWKRARPALLRRSRGAETPLIQQILSTLPGTPWSRRQSLTADG